MNTEISQEPEKPKIKLSKIRRFVLLGIIILFLLQFLRIKILVGGLSGSVAVWFVQLIDVFAFFESLAASRSLTTTAIIAVLPIIAVYIIFGRAFCGWVCPMDFLFELINKAKKWKGMKVKINPKIGYIVAIFFIAGSFLSGMPIFTNYLSHLTNFFRALTGGIFLMMDFPLELDVLIYSLAIIIVLLGLELAFPRLWCRVLCPVGKVYGLFNKISLLKLRYYERECGECNLCDRMCYMGVKVSQHIDRPSLRDTNCIYCGRCVEGCETKGKLVKMKLWG